MEAGDERNFRGWIRNAVTAQPPYDPEKQRVREGGLTPNLLFVSAGLYHRRCDGSYGQPQTVGADSERGPMLAPEEL